LDGSESNVRERIIDAAEDIVVCQGARHVTLDAVVQRAGVSKGGLIYHFKNKEALLQAMLDRLVARTDANRRQKCEMLDKGRGMGIIAYVLASLAQDDKTRKVGGAILAAAAHAPKLLLPFYEEYRKLLEEFGRDGLSPARAAVIMLAVDGLRLMDLLPFSPLSTDERKDVIEEIIKMAKGEKHD
jgi:AcrR family transcriptional regulator